MEFYLIYKYKPYLLYLCCEYCSGVLQAKFAGLLLQKNFRLTQFILSVKVHKSSFFKTINLNLFQRIFSIKWHTKLKIHILYAGYFFSQRVTVRKKYLHPNEKKNQCGKKLTIQNWKYCMYPKCYKYYKRTLFQKLYLL